MTNGRFRKFSPIDREYPIFEFVVDDTILLDVAATDGGELEVAFHQAAADKVFSYEQLQQWLAEGKELLQSEIDDTA